MQQQSSHSVRIIYFNKEIVWNALKQFVRELVKHNPEIKKILLFGSFAKGESVPGSDVDLLIVLEDSDKSFLNRVAKYMPNKFPVSVDVFPYTEAELETMVKEGNFFLRQALKEGVYLFKRDNCVKC